CSLYSLFVSANPLHHHPKSHHSKHHNPHKHKPHNHPAPKPRTPISSPIINNIFDTFTALPENPRGVTRHFEFRLVKANLAVDGVTRAVWTVNGQYPGPVISGNIGDTFAIHVVNELGEPSGMHWHGLDQDGTNWYDGVPGITQCPIKNGKSLSYVFNLTQSGTYWYHSHFMAQYVDGLRGPIVIFDPNDPYKHDYDSEYVMSVADWYHTPTEDPGMLPLFRDVNYQGGDPVPDSGEISGVGQYRCTIPKCKPKKFATYKVKRGHRYRFRLINFSAMSHFTVSFDQHPLKVIEVDGTMIEPYTVTSLPINIAQRYSVIVEMNQPIGNYFIRATISDCSVGGGPGTINGNSPLLNNKQITGILRYEGAPSSIPKSKAYHTKTPDCLDPDSSNPRNLRPINLKKKVPTNKNIHTIKLTVAIAFNPQLEATINGNSFAVNFKNPSYQKVLSGSKFVPTDNAFTYHGLNKPHGHSFWVVARGGTGSSTKPLSSLKYNFENPLYRDTLTLEEFSLTAIMYYADNPGVWLFHCHIEWHVEMGMVAQLVEVPEVFKTYKIPRSVTDMCK
ncbi:9691_t:CDS:2, partial [Acaulospora colombiana]